MRIGTTAIVVGLIDGGKITAAPRLAAPLRALSRFVSDPACRATARLVDGTRASAIDIQRFYLEQAEENLSVLPSWAESIVRVWRGVLDSLEDDPLSLCTTLDWTIKWPIYRKRIAAAGFDPPTLPRWNDVANTVRAAIRKSGKKGLRVEQILDLKHSPIPDTIRKLTPFVEEHGLSWDTFRPFVDLQKSLFELDTRFGQIGDDGLFNRLDRAGVLGHHVPEVTGVDAAMTDPPSSGRAHLRGRVVRKHGSEPGYDCSWDAILDLRGKRFLDMADPFADKVKWTRHNPAKHGLLRIMRNYI